MKVSLSLFFVLFSFLAFSQESFSGPVENHPEFPCLNPKQYAEIEKRCHENAINYSISTSETRSSVQLSWPLKQANGFADCSYYYISAHVDHNAAASAFQDYNCGNITYDGHRGTDIAIGPFPFYKMDTNQVEVIAAATGTILDKHDGEYDRNCVGVGSGLTANYVIVQHSDGSRAMYWHMKSGSITSKAIGQTLVAGEYLGVVGSSGSSSGPHLHFEVWSGSTVSTLIDPFAGTCNLMNGASWWASQKPYTESAVIKASVHTTDIVMPACGITETTNESSSYSIPFQGPGLAPGYAKFYIFMRNETSGTTANMSILNPNNSVFNSWTRNCTNTSKFSYYGYSKLLPTTPGIYTFQAIYNGITCSQSFEIKTTTAIPANYSDASVTVYPNPSKGQFAFKVSGVNVLDKAEIQIRNSLNELIETIKVDDKQDGPFRVTVNLQQPAGLYFYALKSNGTTLHTDKLLIE